MRLMPEFIVFEVRDEQCAQYVIFYAIWFYIVIYYTQVYQAVQNGDNLKNSFY